MSAATGLLERRLSRRGLFARIAVVGSAVTTSGLDYVLHPGTAYASVCGHSSTCSGGWTAMCCTINAGVNQCPPGSFAGGWWKAEGANLCGGKARYYIDCQAECTHCGCHGSQHYCAEHCWNCTPHCAQHGSCDERRVCHNVFRYGQCERDKHCSGPVLCRQISCTPPWKWANCSTASATDDITVSHSAPCLPAWTHIQQRYTALGSEASVLGFTVDREHVTTNWRMQRYTGGRMYWSTATHAHYLTGPVLHHYVQIDQMASPLGLPVTDIETSLDGLGVRARFQHGGIYHQRGGETHALWGDVWQKWRDLYGTIGALGYPITDLKTTAGGTADFARFVSGAIYQPTGADPFVLLGEVAAKYHEIGAEKSRLGLPTGDGQAATDGKGVRGVEVLCAKGAIAQAPQHPACAVWGPIFRTWDSQGRAAGELGFPLTDVTDVPLSDGPGQHCTFAYGEATYDRTTGEVTITLT